MVARARDEKRLAAGFVRSERRYDSRRRHRCGRNELPAGCGRVDRERATGAEGGCEGEGNRGRGRPTRRTAATTTTSNGAPMGTPAAAQTDLLLHAESEPGPSLESMRAPSLADAAGRSRDASTNSSSRTLLLRQLAAEGETLRFGDTIRLRVRSNFVKPDVPKPDWLDPLHLGWTTEELEGGYIGVYVKTDGTDRVVVPPLGSQAKGVYNPSYFVVESASPEGRRLEGRQVKYGDVVVLRDEHDQVWNNKTSGFLTDGYLAPRPRGSPGEVFVSFQKNMMEGQPVRFGDPAVYIDVKDSHRYRQGFNNRLTNYKSANAKCLGGYLCSDGSGDPLCFRVERYKDKARPRLAGTSLPANLDGLGPRAKSAPPQMYSSGSIPRISVVNVVHVGGRRDTMRTMVPYGIDVFVYNLRSDAQLEIVISDGSTAVLEGSSEACISAGFAGPSQTSLPIKTAANDAPGGELVLSIAKVLPSPPNSAMATTPLLPSSSRSVVVDVGLAWIRLIVAYVVSWFFLVAMWASIGAVWRLMLDDESTPERVAAGMLDFWWSEGDDLRSPLKALGARGGGRVNRRLIGQALLLCWFLGFLTPGSVRRWGATRSLPRGLERMLVTDDDAEGSNGANREHDNNGDGVDDEEEEDDDERHPPAVLAVKFEFRPVKPRPTAPNKLITKHQSMYANLATSFESSGSNSVPETKVEKWRAPGVDANGDPNHPAFIRFVNGERGDRAAALRRWEVTCDWRREHEVDSILDVGHRFFFLIKAHYPHCFFGRDSFGHPIYIERLGHVNMKALKAGGAKLKDIVYHYVFTAEFEWTVLDPAEYGQSLTILDCAGIRFYDFAGEVAEFVKKTTGIIQEHYPERGFMVFVINVPVWFSFIWETVKHFVNPRTREKIRILGTDYQTELYKVVPRNALPELYGGTNPEPLDNSQEERLLRNVVVRTLLRTSTDAVGPDGHNMTRAQLEAYIDPSVDHLAGVSRCTKHGPDGQPLCDASGRPLEKDFVNGGVKRPPAPA